MLFFTAVHPMSFHHIPVLLEETIATLNPQASGLYLDCTLGGGGHSEAILNADSKCRLIGLDRDPDAIKAATKRLNPYKERVRLVHTTYAHYLSEIETTFNGILLDVGVSSHQLDTPQRGFSFQHDGPLDMRMNPENGLSASEWIDRIELKKLTEILFKFGEEPRARQIARAIIEGRPWQTTKALADCVARASGYKNSKTHPATRTFQAIRIAINNELDELLSGLTDALKRLAPNGILAVISFHSLEDRIVKRMLRSAAGYNAPKDIYGHPVNPPYGTLIHRKGLDGARYDSHNPRARSARLRAFQRSPLSSPIHLGV